MQSYLAFFHATDSEAFGVTFPQFPGCVSQGDDYSDARLMAAEALSLHIDGMREDGEAIPPSIEDMSQTELTHLYSQARDDVDGPVLPVTIPLLPPQGKSVRIQVTIDDRLLRQIDAVTRNRSAFLAAAAADRLNGAV